MRLLNGTTVLFIAMNTMPEITEQGHARHHKNHKSVHRSVFTANGVWLILTPPYGDEPFAGIIIIAGIGIPLLVHYVAQTDDQREA